METAIKISAKIYTARDAAKKLYGADFKKKIEEYKHFILAATKKHKLQSTLHGAMKLIEDCAGEYGADSATMNILAAYAELIEPTV